MRKPPEPVRIIEGFNLMNLSDPEHPDPPREPSPLRRVFEAQLVPPVNREPIYIPDIVLSPRSDFEDVWSSLGILAAACSKGKAEGRSGREGEEEARLGTEGEKKAHWLLGIAVHYLSWLDRLISEFNLPGYSDWWCLRGMLMGWWYVLRGMLTGGVSPGAYFNGGVGRIFLLVAYRNWDIPLGEEHDWIRFFESEEMQENIRVALKGQIELKNFKAPLRRINAFLERLRQHDEVERKRVGGYYAQAFGAPIALSSKWLEVVRSTMLREGILDFRQ